MSPGGSESKRAASGAFGHVPVLLEEVLSSLAPAPGHVVLDGTVGAGGHLVAMLARLEGRGVALGIDRDPAALRVARDRLRAVLGVDEVPGRCAGGEPSPKAESEPPPEVLARLGSGALSVVLAHGEFGAAARLATREGVPSVDRALLDLGVSSLQLDDPARGFGFARDGPLDMRMDPGAPAGAAEIVNRSDADRLREIIRSYGEDRHAGRIARAIVLARKRRPIRTTGELADIVVRAVPPVARGGRARRERIHPATRTFQAIRIAANDELGALERGLDAIVPLLAPGGRLACIAFHSLEDRIVKGRFRALARAGEARLITRKPIRPGADEIARNPRSRSARLRVIERLEAL